MGVEGVTLRTRKPEPRELAEVAALLAATGPASQAPPPLAANVVVAESDGKLVGAVVLDVFARSGLVRSIVVSPDHRGAGAGRELFRSLLARASELGLKELYAVPGEAEGFFEKLGFQPALDDEIPLAVRRSRAFAAQAADDVMRLRLQ